MMRVLLVASHKVLVGFDRMTRLPNGGLSSIAANVNPEVAEVKIIDLVLQRHNAHPTLLNVLNEYRPHVVGLSCMIFQYAKTLELAKLTRQFDQNITIVFGGYYPTIDYDVIAENEDMQYIDYIIRGEAERSFNQLLQTLKNGGDLSAIPGLTWRKNGAAVHNEKGKLLNLDEIKLPDRDCRIMKKGFHLFGYPADVIETSRGCVFDCDFCSIKNMYGKSFRKYKIERVLDDIRDARKRGARALLVSDDNPTIDGKRYKQLCEAIIDAGLHDMRYYVQASVKGFKNTPGLAEAMVKSGARWIFLGIENESDENLEYLVKSNQFTTSEAYEVVRELKSYGAIVFGGIIIGNPEDDEQKVRANAEYARKLGMDYPIFGILTPYPKTGIRERMLKDGLVTNPDDYSKYDCFHANVRTRHLTPEQLFRLRFEIENRYPVRSGSLFRLFREFPLYFLKLIPRSLIREPRNFRDFIKQQF